MIDPADWAATPVAVQHLVLALQAQLSHLNGQVETMTVQVQTLTTQVQVLTAQLQQTSQNSSNPPSSDPPSAPPRPPRTPRGRPRGAQPDHPGTQRNPRPPDQIVPLAPTTCPDCQCALPPVAPDAVPMHTHQVWEVPPICVHVTEYQLHTLTCPRCARAVPATLPDAATTGYGPRLTALVGHMHGTCHLPYRQVTQFLDDLAGVGMSLGSAIACAQRVSRAVQSLDAAIHTHLQTAPVVHVDETGWKEAGQRRWLWVGVSAQATCFRITTSRGRVGLDDLLPAHYPGIVVSDRYPAYNRYPATQRQLCWAHLQRTICGLAEADMPDSSWADAVLVQVQAVFHAWHAFRDGTTDRAGLQAALVPIQQALQAAIADGQTRTWTNVHDLGHALRTWWEALWTFARCDGVEPTNNTAERALWPAVIWRKICFGTQSPDGNRVVERLLSVVATCRQQGRNVLALLTEAVTAAQTGGPAPILLPTP